MVFPCRAGAVLRSYSSVSFVLCCLPLKKSVSCAHQLLTQEIPSQTEGRTKATALDSPNRLSCLILFLCHLILILGIFPFTSAPLSLTASVDLCPVWAGQPLTPWKRFSRCQRDDKGAGAQHIWK